MEKINEISKKLRTNILRLSHKAKSSHIGSCLSIVDILVVLYSDILKSYSIKKKSYQADKFILSKGHACLVYYAVLCEMGFFSKDKLKQFEKTDSFLLGHPVMNKKYGIDFSTGSLGMGLSIGVGIALSLKKKLSKKKVYVLVGDGECNEGSIWEAIMSAAHFKLDNLVIIIDRNNFQQTGTSKEIMNIDKLDQKLSSFGCENFSTDGHDTKSLIEIFSNLNLNGLPKSIIANTIKGFGFSFSRNNNKFHHTVITKALYEQGLKEIGENET